MLRLSALYFSLVFLSLGYQSLLKTGFGKNIFMSYVTMAFVMFLCSVLGKLSYFKYFLAVLLISAAASIWYSYRKNKKIPDVKELFSPSFFVFLIAFFYLYFVMRTKAFSQVDDIFRWSAKVQEALRLDCLYTSTQYSYISPNFYPPFTTLNEIFFNKMLGGYNDSWSLFANSSLCFVLLLPFCDRLKWTVKDSVKAVSQLFIIFGLLLSVNLNPTMNGNVFLFNTTYPDWITGLMIASGFLQVLWFENKLSDYVYFCFLNSALLQTDRICFAFSLLICATLVIRLVVCREFTSQSIKRFVLLGIAIPVVLYFSWRVYLSTFDPKLLFHIAISNGNIISVIPNPYISSNSLAASVAGNHIISFAVAEHQMQILSEYIKRFFFEPVYIHPFPISYFVFNLLVSGTLLGLYHFNRDSKQLVVISVFYFLGSLAYAATVCFTYMFSFSYEEAVSLAVYGRYMQSYTLSGLVLMIFTLLTYIRHDVIYPIVLVIVFCFAEPLSFETAIATPGKETYMQKEREVIRNYVETEYNGEPTLVVDSTDIAYYFMIRNIYAEKAANITLYQNGSESTAAEFAEKCKDREFVLIGEADERFIAIWNELTDVPCYNTTLYRVVHEENTISFEMVYSFEAMIRGTGD